MIEVAHTFDPLFARRRRLSTCNAPKPNARVIAHPYARASSWSLDVLECLMCGRTSSPRPASGVVTTPTSEKNEMA